jgi:small basic protein (TIGR04137 family)
MTQHPSFTRSGSGAANRRSVLKRHERVDLLKKRGLWADGNSVTSLPKTKPEA